MKHLATLCIVTLWTATAVAAVAQRKEESASVRIEFNRPPQGMKTGDETTTTIVLRAIVDTDRVDVYLGPDDGLEIVSAPPQTSITGLESGDTREVVVKVKLTAPKGSSLNVSVATQSGGHDGARAVAIDYGEIEH